MITRIMMLAALLLAFPAAYAQVSVDYGTVVAVVEVEEDDTVGKGALVGGLMGAVIGPRDAGLNRGVVAGAAAGAAVDYAHKDYLYRYTVELHDGDTVAVETEQEGISVGQCVTIERGEYANLRPVSSFHCEDPVTVDPPEHHSDMADQCHLAKEQLLAAQGDDVDAAIEKVRILCED